MVLMVEKEGVRGGICHVIQWYAKATNKYIKDYDKNKKSSYLEYMEVNTLHGSAMSRNLPLNNFKWVEDISQYD